MVASPYPVPLFTLPSPAAAPTHFRHFIPTNLPPPLLPGPPDCIPNRRHLFPRSWPRRNRSLAPSLRSPSLQSLILLIILTLYLFIIIILLIINIIIIRTPRPQSKRSMRNPQCQQTKSGAGWGDIGRG